MINFLPPRSAVVAVMAVLWLSVAPAPAAFITSTEVVGYQGSYTTYGSLANALAGTNPTGGGVVPQRDLALYVTNNVPDFDPLGDATVILTRWRNVFAGLPDPTSTTSNQTLGFLQIADYNASTTTSASGFWTSAALDTFRLQVSGVNATYAADVARFGATGGLPSVSYGTFVNYSFDATFTGLAGVFDPGSGRYTSTNVPPSGASGTFTGVFQGDNGSFFSIALNINAISEARTLGYTSRANEVFSSGEIRVSSVPEPGTAVGLVGGLGWVVFRLRRRRSFTPA